MNRYELEQRLLAEGCVAHSFAIGRLGDDAFCLVQVEQQWQVVYAERGFVREVLFCSDEEAEACDFLYRQVLSFSHSHLVGFFSDRADLEAMQAWLEGLALPYRHDQIVYTATEYRYRLFVVDRDLFQVRDRFPNLPLNRYPPVGCDG